MHLFRKLSFTYFGIIEETDITHARSNCGDYDDWSLLPLERFHGANLNVGPFALVAFLGQFFALFAIR